MDRELPICGLSTDSQINPEGAMLNVCCEENAGTVEEMTVNRCFCVAQKHG